MDDYQNAVKAARNATEQQPTYVWSHLVLGSALEMTNQYEEAIMAYNYAIQLEPDWHVPYQNAAYAHLDNEELDNALDMFKKVVELHPSSHFAYVGMGDIQLEKGNTEEAEHMYQKADSLSNAANIDIRWSYIYVKKGRIGEALKSLETAFKAGYDFFDYLREVPHLEEISEDPEFLNLLTKYETSH